ncbi:MAG: alkaline phosphatase family protein [Pseudanabaenales cyanobacterium]|nr:alkaline phosphatase family protein [Pseudanabaenales cyanobacterium]
MKKSLIAIELDAADPVLLEDWMSQGHLANLRKLREQGTYGHLTNIDYYTTETKWTTFLTGCLPNQTGYWGPLKLQADTYDVEHGSAYDFGEYPPFYALGDDYRVAAFDLPQSTLCQQVNGPQVLAWGAHAPYTPSHSHPPQLLHDLISKYGKHPTSDRSAVVNWWKQESLTEFQQALKVGVSRRSNICRCLLQQENWDLFLTSFSETHPAGHNFCHLSQPDHPLYRDQQRGGSLGDLLLDVYEAIDQAIGEILAEAPDDAYILIFSTHGMGNNSTDLPSVLFLPEFLYRFSFPGKFALAPGKSGTTAPPMITAPKRRNRNWAREVWQLKYDHNPIKQLLKRWIPDKFQAKLEQLFDSPQQLDLASPQKLSKQLTPYSWQPTMWYKPLWPHMKAFALPTFGGEGFIRINLQGREPEGIVTPCEYDALCDELTQQLHRLQDARTGQPIVKKVVRTRQCAMDSDPKLPDADLVAVWRDLPTDVIDSPEWGRIGPAPYTRTGSHRLRGFLMARGPNIPAGSSLESGHAIDLAPTILKLMGAPIPEYCEGQPLL